MRRASIDTSLDPTYGLVRASLAGEIARGGASCSSLTCYFLPSVVCCALVCSLGTVECWGGRQGGCGLELCVRQLRVCGSQLAVCLVSLFVSVCRSCVPSSSVPRPPIPRWCPVRAWLFFTFLPTYLPGECIRSTTLPQDAWMLVAGWLCGEAIGRRSHSAYHA